ncbi:MAG TPA: phosphoenolpyruvate synthase, partial [Candidatus Nanoarchaeia archaeon]|nr:phosphoenolpyruvate synthase [Candidatus Nanoarchaeia archaeon]
MDKAQQFILWFDQLAIEDVPLVGGKNASLGEMYRELTPKGVRIPNGFAVTAYAYRYLLEKAGLVPVLKAILSDLNTKNLKNLAKRGAQARAAIRKAVFPQELQQAIIEAYGHLGKQYGTNTDVAVRSSATAEDLPDASFAGQQETYLNIRGEKALLEACKNCFASLFTDRAISYRVDRGFDHFSIALSIGVQKMIRSDLACSGVMFSIDTETGFRNAVLINGSWGLGENIVQGAVNPDEFYVFKPALKSGKFAVISKSMGTKKIKMIYGKGKRPTVNIRTKPAEQERFVLNDAEIQELARWGLAIEEYYSQKAGKFKPMDMEWAKDGKQNKLYIVQARPETVQAMKDQNVLEEYILEGKGAVLSKGHAVGQKIGAGKARVIKGVKEIGKVRKGEVIVTEMTDPDWEPVMKIAAAIVTERGGKTCHAAIVSRELGIPCVVGTENCTRTISNGQPITVSCAEGDEGFVYNGILKFRIEKRDLRELPKTRTKIMVNIGNPDQAFATSFLPVQGVGLAREEFIINSSIKIHPNALLQFKKLKDRKLQKQIEVLTKGYTDKAQFYVDKLAEGIARIAAAFHPHDVILRFSDFKSNEYANLIGGKLFEPKENNPMIGWRGASRYYDPRFTEAFGLECMAVKKVRETMGLTNVIVMIPVCRTVEEGKQVLDTMAKHGLPRGENGLKVYAMCEIPSNVILAKQFLEIFDGFSIGSNDLTQMTLGVDRDSELVAHIYDERNGAVKAMVRQVIQTANAQGKYIGICGQAPSDHP